MKKHFGKILTVLAALPFIPSAVMKLTQNSAVIEGFGKFAIAENLIFPIGVVELIAVLLYLIPNTAALGAILLTGYLGGAIMTHLRVGDPFIAPLVIGILLWAALFVRIKALRSLIPLNKM